MSRAVLISVVMSLLASTAMANLQFHEMSCDNYDLCLSIAFDDGADDFLLMNKYQGIDTIFVGTLMTEGTSATVVYSNSEEIEIVISSSHLGNESFFLGDRNTGIAVPKAIAPHADVALPHKNYVRSNNVLGRESRALPSLGFRLDVHVYYDDKWNTRFGSGAATKVQTILAMVKSIYSHASLTTVVDPNLVAMTHQSGANWIPDVDTLNSVSSIARNNPSNANAYVFLTEQSQGGYVGIAWVGGTCESSGYYRSSITSYFHDDFTTANILAHEIGHNLGMAHDFGDSQSDPRYSSSGELCTNNGGYMDYLQNPYRWTSCSVEDFTAYYNRVNPFCLDALEETVTTTVAPTVPEDDSDEQTDSEEETTTQSDDSDEDTDSEEETTTQSDDSDEETDSEEETTTQPEEETTTQTEQETTTDDGDSDEDEESDEDDEDDNDDDTEEEDEDCVDKKPWRFCRRNKRRCQKSEKIQDLCKKTCEMCSDDDDSNGDEDDGDGDSDEDDNDEDDEEDTDDEDECKDEKPTWWCNWKKRSCKWNQHIQNLCKKTCEMCSDVDDEDDGTTTCEDTSGSSYCRRRKWRCRWNENFAQGCMKTCRRC